MEGKQMEFDLRLDYQRNLKDNLNTVTKFAEEQMRDNMEESGRPLKRVESKHEAYGISAQQFVRVEGKEKILKGQMADFLKLLDADDEATQVAGTIYNASIELAQEAILMAAQASRILADLYYSEPKTPLEEFYEAQEAEAEADADPEVE